MFYKITLCMSILLSFKAFGSWNKADSLYSSKRFTESRLRSIVIELVDDNYYSSSIPWMKSYLTQSTKNLDRKIENKLSLLLENVGLKQFETLPLRFLQRSSSDNIRYIISKKYLRSKKYGKALSYLAKISSNHPIYPFAKNMEGAIYSIISSHEKSKNSFEECIESSEDFLDKKIKRNLVLNRDYCILGKARTSFANRKYDQSDLLYLDVPKSSLVWPEILFEEAWNSYYQKNYNRTLGKLVSYKAPVLNHMFNPEVEVLEALSFLKLCLFSDAKKVSDNFYKKYMKDTRKLRNHLNRNKRKTIYFYDQTVRFTKTGRSNTPLQRKLMRQIVKEEVFVSLLDQLKLASNEYDRVRNNRSSRFKKAVVSNLKEVIKTQQRIIGAHVKGRLISHYANLYKAFEGMSYIKLEVLAQRKARLYSLDDKKRERGDSKYIQKNDKQYFWDFNGEFWADELGDYVFALRSEC